MEQFIVSARKYRPQTFADVVGQEVITNTLNNAIENNHLAQALLFTGPRGVGKTTCARILARKINQPGYDDPNEDFSFNIFELDAASNNSVDDIRNLIDQVRIPPQTGKYKVYIIDEVHMLSNAAFNAFLKTLEEPPQHVIFILATTEKHKIIPTILSRCQIFDFKRITIQDAKNHLIQVAESQYITFEEDALQIIAQKADGAMRDALSIFDRVVSYCGNHLTRQAVAENLNVLDFEYYLNVTNLIATNNIPQLLLEFDEVLAKGFDGHHFVIGLASHFRNLMVSKRPETARLLQVSEQSQQRFVEQANQFSHEQLVRAIDIANRTELSYKNSQNQRLLVELCLMQLASVTHPEAEKKKAELFLIPPSFFVQPTIKDIEVKLPEVVRTTSPEVAEPQTVVEKPQTDNRLSGALPALSLKSVKYRKQIEQELKKNHTEEKDLPEDQFTTEQVLDLWKEYADRFTKTGRMLMSSIMNMVEPKIDGNTITIELPNQGSKISFEENIYDLTNGLRKKLNNYALQIKVEVNETITIKKAFTIEDKFNYFKELNPNMETLKKMFDLDLDAGS
ncbi:DNA polymerase III subunit gamma/tau [Avrilella dinanensis]|uniref:DNA polymerase III subunit gamma/tau n=1 Tax=Avrilella dinanensis TaxID=2008672 RepID=A0A2M9R529_9FLAO|nr:DNA polymerase III subunit gamma/tau [Avrilella dinanensis]PJR03969.1 DNA polymerase III subunit gamma/tau [Avrilella dinanensis]